jgi:hypothetical protein
VSSARRVSWDAGFWFAAAVVLTGACVAIGLGIAPGRMRPIAGFALVWLGAASYVLAAKRAMERRAARLRTAQVPRDVKLTRPIWIPLREGASLLGMAGALAACAAAVGYPWVGLGILLALAALAVPMVADIGTVSGLSFEYSGLRLDLGRAECLVPWTLVLEVSVAGQPGVPSVNVAIADPAGLYHSLVPDTPKTRFALHLLLGLGMPSGRALRFYDWSAGLDAPTLARTIREATGEPPPRAN